LISIRFGARAASDDAARRRSVGGHDSSDVHGWQADIYLVSLLRGGIVRSFR
jgi:hypothetical protein